MKFLWLDEWYQDAWDAFTKSDAPNPSSFVHGTSDYWDTVLRLLEHKSGTYIHNDPSTLFEMTSMFDVLPDIVCVQNVGRWKAKNISDQCKKVAFISYGANLEDATGWDVVFTSFPDLISMLENAGQRAVLLPLAFGKPVLDRIDLPKERDLPLTFIGGLGHTHIWKRGTEILTAVAETFPEFQWWGYRPSTGLPAALEKSWQGEAWGPEYFKLLARSKVTINRHGEISKGCGNNMRQYEATAMGACLVTDEPGQFRPNVDCMTYKSIADILYVLRVLTSDDKSARIIAKQGQETCLENHCYENRVERFLEVVDGL